MKIITTPLCFNKSLLALAVTCGMSSANAVQFNMGDIEGSFDSQLSIGSSWRVESQDAALTVAGNNEDGNKNFKGGDAFSQIFKGTHDLQVSYQNFGGFIRGKYWYDSALENNNVENGHGPTATVGTGPQTPLQVSHAGASRLDDSEFHDLAKFSGAEIFDAYVYGEFELGHMPLDVRLGKQVVSWGESTFIFGGINAINPVDISALRRPGAEIKEALIPVNMAYANMGITDDLSVEAFYQLAFQETVIPGCGTYFSTNDYAPQGCDLVTLSAQNASLQRDENGNRPAKDDGQFGAAFRYVLGDVELGAYAMNIHSRAPLASGIYNNVDEAAIGSAAGTNWIVNNAVNPAAPTAQELATAQAVGTGAATVALVNSTKYFVGFPEDIQLFGLSFATNVASMALSGEVSHKVKSPIQINATQLIAATIQGGTAGVATLGMDSAELDADVAAAGEGGIVKGYREFDVTQAQVTGIKFFDQVAGASRLTLIGEAGYTYIHDFKEGAGEIRFGRSGIYDTPENTEGFVTESSWGYRARIVANYPNVFSGINLKPVLAWSHDVKGFAPQPGGAFREGQQSLGLTVKADYLAVYNASIGYTQYMGGDYSVISDRDFASVSIGMQF